MEVMRQNWNITDAGMNTAERRANLERVTGRGAEAKRARHRYTHTAPTVMPSMATLIAKKAM